MDEEWLVTSSEELDTLLILSNGQYYTYTKEYFEWEAVEVAFPPNAMQAPPAAAAAAAASAEASPPCPPSPPLPSSPFNEEIQRRAQETPMTKSRCLKIEQRFEAICNTLRRSGLALTITVHAKEDQLQMAMPMVHDLRYDDPLKIIMDLQDLELGDVVAMGLANDKLYYAPRASPNIYRDPLKREPFSKLREDEQKQMLAFAKKHKSNLPLRIASLESKVLHLSNMEENLERSDHAIRELLKLNKIESSYEDLVQALREQVEDLRQHAIKVPSLEARVRALELGKEAAT